MAPCKTINRDCPFVKWKMGWAETDPTMDIEAARREGKVIKLVCEGGIATNGKIYGRVTPTTIDLTDSLAGTVGTTSALQLKT